MQDDREERLVADSVYAGLLDWAVLEVDRPTAGNFRAARLASELQRSAGRDHHVYCVLVTRAALARFIQYADLQDFI